jgi:hypothetical protein
MTEVGTPASIGWIRCENTSLASQLGCFDASHWGQLHGVSDLLANSSCLLDSHCRRPAQPNHSFQPYAVFIEDTNSRTEGRCSGLFWKKAMKYDSYH